ncbi:hypothetical protein NS220_00695 [Microbacterium testaceum]|uniref:DUF2809 domain-containing protein n=1 Tax=Microbacterium testaceum TaxID=2033 RepID=A0A147F1E5_MICTE|nr:DUF2809 domain-containing protein [Microbacterium testaceum]KTR96737.1 hypothetical protein NS220_00695 [Microbacterium testaceum]
MTHARRRVAAAIALVAVVILGLVVAKGMPATDITDVMGDALYAVAVFTGLVLLWPRGRRSVLGIVAVTWCVGVEFFQLTGLPVALADRFPPAALVLGSGFDPRDLVVYVLAVATAAAVDAAVGALLLHGGRRRGRVGGRG